MAKARRQDGVTTQDLPLPKVYGLLEPGPVVFLTTADRSRANVMTLSWHMMVEFTPPLIACVVSRANYSQAALRKTKQRRKSSGSATARGVASTNLRLSA